MNWKSSRWHTLWQGPNIVVQRDGVEIDRVRAPDVSRVVVVYRGDGDQPGELSYALFELPDEMVIFPAETGIAGRVHFERQAFWAERNCIWWVSEADAGVPPQFRRGPWRLGRAKPDYLRVAKGDLAALVDRWPLQGPQTWEERKWQRIERSRPFATPSEFEAAAFKRAGR